MSEEKPRHERIIERLNNLTEKKISEFVVSADGVLYAYGSGKDTLISGFGAPAPRKVIVDQPRPAQQGPLIRRPTGWQLAVGTIDSTTLTLGGIPIYGTGAPGSVPLLPLTNADVYAQASVSPVSIYNAFGSYWVGNMDVLSASVITMGLGILPTDIKATLNTSTGAFTAGTYFYWIARIVDGAVVTTPSPFPRQYQGALAIDGNFGASVGMFSPGTPATDPDITYIP